MTRIGNFVKLYFLSVIMDPSEYQKILHYKKLSANCRKLLTRKERNFMKRLAKFTLVGNQLYREGKLVLNGSNVVAIPTSDHGEWGHPGREEMERKVRENYDITNLRLICRKIVTTCKESQNRTGVRRTGPMVHLNKQRIARLCKQLGLPSNGTTPLSQAFVSQSFTRTIRY